MERDASVNDNLPWMSAGSAGPTLSGSRERDRAENATRFDETECSSGMGADSDVTRTVSAESARS